MLVCLRHRPNIKSTYLVSWEAISRHQLPREIKSRPLANDSTLASFQGRTQCAGICSGRRSKSAKPEGSNCLLEKEAATAFWLCARRPDVIVCHRNGAAGHSVVIICRRLVRPDLSKSPLVSHICSIYLLDILIISLLQINLIS